MTPSLHPVLLSGVAIFFASAILFMGIVFAKGGAKRSRQLGVMLALVRGEHGALSRGVTIGSFAGIILGALLCFAGIAAQDVAREKRCQARCVAEGHLRGKIGPSSEKSMTRRGRAAFVACVCSGGSGPPIELNADQL